MTWQDIDPARHPFDPEQALDVVREVVSSPDPDSGRPRGLWSTNSVARGLSEHYGSWAFGWSSAMDPSPDSGQIIKDLPISGRGVEGLEQQAKRYTSALLQWRVWLEELAAVFAQFAPEPNADEQKIRGLRERGVAPLVTLVVERTGAGEAWRGPCTQALIWYLESTGMSPREAEELADDVVDAEFQSWIAPDEEAVDRVREAIGEHDA
jgi:hypothetical protein